MKLAVLSATAVLAVSLAAPAPAASHSWVVNEIFSNADGTVQFIEMKECCGAPDEVRLDGKWMESDATGAHFDFPGNLECTMCTANKHLLFGTAAFAALPGAPTPDYIIADNFVDLSADTIRYWMYSSSPMTYTNLPLDGVNSVVTGGTVGANTPTNFADETGSVTVPCDPADLDGNGDVGFGDVIEVLSNWGPCPAECPQDLNGNLSVDFGDLIQVLSSWSACTG